MRAPELWRRRSLVSALLAPAAAAFDLAGLLRQRLTTPARLPVPVICVGNLVAGGAGKTPLALALAHRLAGDGVHLLSRGYGGKLRGPVRVDPAAHTYRMVGDEALLLAEAAPTWVARDRVAGARAAVDAGASLLVLDDGLQNPGIRPDLALLAVDGGYGFGNGRVMPAGPLRESFKRGFARAHAVVLIGADATGIAGSLARRVPVLHARLVLQGPREPWIGRRVVAFAGIGRPQKFFDTLTALGAKPVSMRSFPDHHPYSEREIDALLREAREADAVAVTTAKDAVRLPAAFRGRIEVLPVALAWTTPVDEMLLDDLLAERASPK